MAAGHGGEISYKENREGDKILNELALEIIIIFLLLVANGVFAMSELAVVAARKIRLQQLADSGSQ